MEKYISIVFDDGPREPMKEMIDKFKKFGFRCGFAIIGNKITDNTLPLLKYAIENGFELVTHSENHSLLKGLTENEIFTEFFTPIEKIKQIFGYEIKNARSPYLYIDKTISNFSIKYRLPLLGQGINGAFDWEPDTTPKEISDSLTENIYDGAFVTFHVTENTNCALDTMLPFLKENGYIAVTPNELFEIKNIKNIPLGDNIEKL